MFARFSAMVGPSPPTATADRDTPDRETPGSDADTEAVAVHQEFQLVQVFFGVGEHTSDPHHSSNDRSSPARSLVDMSQGWDF